MEGRKEILALSHARPGCACRIFSEESFRVEGVEYRVRVPVCRSGPRHYHQVIRLVEQVSQYTLLRFDQAREVLRAHCLGTDLLAQVEPASAHWLSLRSLARLTKGQPRRHCAWCNRRFNRRVGPARRAEVRRRCGRRLQTIPQLVCSLACGQQLLQENVRYLKWLASELAVVRALKKQRRALNRLARQQSQEGQPPPASMCS